MDYWRHGAPPDDDETLAAIARLPVPRWRKLRPVIAPFFTAIDGKWRQKRADEEMAKRTNIIAERSKAGKEGAAKRHGNTIDRTSCDWGKRGSIHVKERSGRRTKKKKNKCK